MLSLEWGILSPAEGWVLWPECKMSPCSYSEGLTPLLVLLF